MSARLPYGAREIAALRSAGQRPSDLILVSLIGPLRESNPVVIAKADLTYDWRFLIGLSVAVVATTETPYMPLIVQAIEAAAPRSMAVWFADQQDGHNLIVQSRRASTKFGRRMGVIQRIAWAGLGTNTQRRDCILLIARQTKRRAMENTGRFDAALIEMAQAGFKRIFGKALEES